MNHFHDAFQSNTDIDTTLYVAECDWKTRESKTSQSTVVLYLHTTMLRCNTTASSDACSCVNKLIRLPRISTWVLSNVRQKKGGNYWIMILSILHKGPIEQPVGYSIFSFSVPRKAVRMNWLWNQLNAASTFKLSKCDPKKTAPIVITCNGHHTIVSASLVPYVASFSVSSGLERERSAERGAI